MVDRGDNGKAIHNEMLLFERTPHSFSVIVDVRMQHNEGGYKFEGEAAMMERALHAMVGAAKQELGKRSYLCILNALKKKDDEDDEDDEDGHH